MIAIGFDPGTARLGFGVIETDPYLRALDYGIVVSNASEPMALRLLAIHREVATLIDRFAPDAIAVETLFFARNVTTAMTVGQARGVVLLAAAERGVTVAEYSPSEVKQAVVGYGKADKHQIQELVRIILGLEHVPTPDDAADALAVAICHAQIAPFATVSVFSVADRKDRPRSARRRLDEDLVTRGLAESRSRAQALIMAGDVLVNGTPSTRAGAAVQANDLVTLRKRPQFVSRGGEKLAHALDVFGLDVQDRVAADFGASTGGFTDCLLQRGATRVYAIDVGHGQLATQLRDDERVVAMDRTNVRFLELLPQLVDLVTIDVSFIGLKLVLPAARSVLGSEGMIVALVKPQFEAGPKAVGRGGVVRDPEVHAEVLRQLFATGSDMDLGVRALTASPLRGPAGNVEFLALLVPNEPSIDVDAAVADALAQIPLK